MPRIVSAISLLLLLLGTAMSSPAASPPLVLHAADASAPLGGHLDILEDKEGTLTIDEVSAPATATRFVVDERDVPSLGFTKSVYWLRFTIAKDAGVERAWLLELTTRHMAYLDFYAPRPQGGFELAQAGAMRPMSLRQFAHRNPVFRLDVDEAAKTVYLRADAREFALFPLTLWSPDAFTALNHQRDILQGCFFGAILVMCAYHLFLFFSLRDRSYLYYVFDIFCLALFEFAIKGFLLETFTAEHPLFNRYTFILGAPAIFAGLLFTRSLLSTDRHAPSIDRIMRLLMPATLLAIPAALVMPPTASRLALTVLASGSALTVLAAGVAALRAGFRPARYYLCGRIARLTGLFIYVLAMFRVLPWNFLAWYGMQIGVILEAVFLAFALADRINVMRSEKEAAESEALRATEESERNAVALAEEMTVELREALAGEQRALARQNRFMAMLSHEYRTPLAIIGANLDLMALQEAESGDNHQPRLTTMKHAVGRLVEVMEVSLQTERLNGFRQPGAMERIALVPFLDAVIDSAEGLWPERHFVFEPEAAAAIMAETGTLKTALFNLLDNACKYSPPEEPVTIECRADQGTATIVIQDRGKGIPPGEAGKVFEKYYRGAGSSDGHGAGVGLWLVRQIVEQFGGTVALDRGAGGGTAATVRLPLARDGGERQRAQSS